MYWHWGSLHNSFETYWKGLLSQDYSPNPTYREAADFGREIAEHADALTGLTKRNRVAVMVSNEALTALEWFSLETGFPRRYSGGGANYNDVFRWVYDVMVIGQHQAQPRQVQRPDVAQPVKRLLQFQQMPCHARRLSLDRKSVV